MSVTPTAEPPVEPEPEGGGGHDWFEDWWTDDKWEEFKPSGPVGIPAGTIQHIPGHSGPGGGE